MTADQFSLSITLGNDGMQTLDDIADALERVAHRLRKTYDTEGKIADVNGNTVGTFRVGEADDDYPTALRAEVVAEVARLEQSGESAPIGGWRNRAVRAVADSHGINPYALDRLIRVGSES